MCGRYANHVGAMHGWAGIINDWPEHAVTGYNIAPTQMIPVFTPQGGDAMRWGLLPNWVTEPQTGYSTFNARLKTVAEKPAFRHAWKKAQRCLVPAVGYYEWKLENGAKQPYFVRRHDENPLVFAGIFEPARESIPASCSILTRPSEGLLEPLHHAMPVMLDPAHGEAWLSGSTDECLDIAWRDYADDYQYYPVSKAVNKVANQGAELIEPDYPQQTPQQHEQSGFDF